MVVSSLNAGQQAAIEPFDTTVCVTRSGTGIPIERYGVSLYWGSGPVPAICPYNYTEGFVEVHWAIDSSIHPLKAPPSALSGHTCCSGGSGGCEGEYEEYHYGAIVYHIPIPAGDTIELRIDSIATIPDYHKYENYPDTLCLRRLWLSFGPESESGVRRVDTGRRTLISQHTSARPVRLDGRTVALIDGKRQMGMAPAVVLPGEPWEGEATVLILGPH